MTLPPPFLNPISDAVQRPQARDLAQAVEHGPRAVHSAFLVDTSARSRHCVRACLLVLHGYSQTARSTHLLPPVFVDMSFRHLRDKCCIGQGLDLDPSLILNATNFSRGN